MFKRGGKWYAWNPVTGRKTTTKCTDKDAARRVVAEWERRAADPTYHDAASKTLAHGAELVLAVKRRSGKADGTLSMYDQKIAQLGRVFGDGTPLAALMSGDRVAEYVDTREREGMSASTIHKELVVLRQILKHARNRGWVQGDISAVMPVGFSPKYVARKVFLPVTDWPKLLDGEVRYTPKKRARDRAPRKTLVRRLPKQRGAQLAFALATGANLNECKRARREHIDLRRGYVFVDGTKRESRKRYVPVTAVSKPLLERVLRDAPGDDYLFAPWGSMWRDLGEWSKALGFPRLTSNDLRRSFGSMLAQAGVPFEVIAKLMGHASTKMVMEVYGQMRPRDLAAIVHQYVPAPGRPSGTRVGRASGKKPSQPSPTAARPNAKRRENRRELQ